MSAFSFLAYEALIRAGDFCGMPTGDESAFGRIAAIAGVAIALAATTPQLAGAAERDYSAAAYGGLAAWIDIYDHGPWARPVQTIRRLARRGAGTVFVQASNYRQRRALNRPAALSRMLAAADRAGLRTIAWYLPGFDRPRRDLRRVRAALSFAEGGRRFDGFALDIEATAVRDVAVRNRRMLWLSRRLRRLAGDRAALGAIVPDPVTQRYWPRFPYRRVRALYDVFLPMSYWTPHLSGEAQVHRYTSAAIRLIRARAGDRAVPIHVIGGVANLASAAEVRGFGRAARERGAAGASLYDAPITSAAQWNQLRRIGALGGRQPPRARAGSARSIQAIRASSQRLR
jgi:hypothetical protein